VAAGKRQARRMPSEFVMALLANNGFEKATAGAAQGQDALVFAISSSAQAAHPLQLKSCLCVPKTLSVLIGEESRNVSAQ
jgi:hypothetical protein